MTLSRILRDVNVVVQRLQGLTTLLPQQAEELSLLAMEIRHMALLVSPHSADVSVTDEDVAREDKAIATSAELKALSGLSLSSLREPVRELYPGCLCATGFWRPSCRRRRELSRTSPAQWGRIQTNGGASRTSHSKASCDEWSPPR
jgi:hypothetical protein